MYPCFNGNEHRVASTEKSPFTSDRINTGFSSQCPCPVSPESCLSKERATAKGHHISSSWFPGLPLKPEVTRWFLFCSCLIPALQAARLQIQESAWLLLSNASTLDQAHVRWIFLSPSLPSLTFHSGLCGTLLVILRQYL